MEIRELFRGLQKLSPLILQVGKQRDREIVIRKENRKK
jgi:hypothetical protein